MNHRYHHRGEVLRHYPVRMKDTHLQYTTTQDESKALPFITFKEAMDVADRMSVPTSIKTCSFPLGEVHIIICGRYDHKPVFLHEVKPKADPA